MARNGRGGVRHGLVFAVLLALIAYASGVSVRDSLAELAAARGAGSEGDKSRADVSGSLVQGQAGEELAVGVSVRDSSLAALAAAAGKKHARVRGGSPAVSVNITERFQTMAGFGASDAWYAHYVGLFWPVKDREAAAQLLFNQTSGIGLSMWRYNIGSGSEGE
jgi:hypothetical protein